MGRRVDVIILDEFGNIEPFTPIILMVTHKRRKELFRFLMGTFVHTIRLGMICCRRSSADSKKGIEVFDETSNKLLTSVRYYFLWQSMSSENLTLEDKGPAHTGKLHIGHNQYLSLG